jgi:cell filamentation protein
VLYIGACCYLLAATISIFVIMKYKLPDSQAEILPNLLGLTTEKEIGESEFEGFLRAEIYFTEKLSERTKFDVKYILSLHKEALKHLYPFAGKLRSVNLSKGGFPFAAAKFLPDSMSAFEKEVLSSLKKTYEKREDIVRDIAIVHGELLFIHPFREGNGRTARLLANLMSRKAGYGTPKFEKVGKTEFEKYVVAVQNCAKKDYTKIIEFMDSIFPD